MDRRRKGRMKWITGADQTKRRAKTSTQGSKTGEAADRDGAAGPCAGLEDAPGVTRSAGAVRPQCTRARRAPPEVVSACR